MKIAMLQDVAPGDLAPLEALVQRTQQQHDALLKVRKLQVSQYSGSWIRTAAAQRDRTLLTPYYLKQCCRGCEIRSSVQWTPQKQR